MKVAPGSIMIPKAYSNANAGRSSKTADGDATITTKRADSVTLSDTTRNLQKITSAMDSPRSDRTDKINALKNAIQNGEYQIDSEQIAERMLDSFLPPI